MTKELEALERMCCATLEEDLSVKDIYYDEYLNIKKALLKQQEQEKELAVYKLAYEWACNRIEGNPYCAILDKARRNKDAWERINEGEKVGVINE